MSQRLKLFLFKQYDGFGDKRVKDISKDYPFKIDDQSSLDVHDQFCGIFLRVIADDRIELSLSNNAPFSRPIKSLLKSKGAEVRTIKNRSHVKVELSVSDIQFIRDLSKQVAALVAPGKEYKDRNWKWLCPRTADSLDRLANALSKYHQN
jgi:hypothetical protein